MYSSLIQIPGSDIGLALTSTVVGANSADTDAKDSVRIIATNFLFILFLSLLLVRLKD
jgi:hypothetical protein